MFRRGKFKLIIIIITTFDIYYCIRHYDRGCGPAKKRTTAVNFAVTVPLDVRL